MNRTVKRLARGIASLALAVVTLWVAARASTAEDIGEAVRSLKTEELALALLRFERGVTAVETPPSLPVALALHMTPLLLVQRADTDAAPAEQGLPPAEHLPDAKDPGGGYSPPSETASPEVRDVYAAARDNGVSSTTLRPSSPDGYIISGSTFVRNTSAAALEPGDLSERFTPPETEGEGPLVLIVHTHGCEAYTMPEGEEYEESDDHRTLDAAYSVLRVGDEIAAALEEAGIGVVHDRTLHDYPSYSGSYERSLATIKRCMSENPSIVYVLDVHRDAVEDESGKQYKLLCAECPGAAQLEFVIGSDGGGLSHPLWRENLRLACAVQETLLARYPTLMRPIVVRNSRYNQQVCPGSLLLEVGTAGNSLEEALNAARLFASGFAETIRK